MKSVLLIYRHPRFSPNSVEKDRAILSAVAGRLRKLGVSLRETVEEDGGNWEFAPCKPTDCILTMGRLPETLEWLRWQQCLVINRPEAVAHCSRTVVSSLMSIHHIPAPSLEGTHGYWLKRGDACAQQPGDVVFCRDRSELERQQAVFRQRGIDHYVVSAHEEGDLVKFYGVRHTPFFRCFYPTDDGESKFGDEQHNGQSHHYDFSLDNLHGDATRLAEAIGIDVYGGDCIVRPDGTYCIIDFNDWPSFSRCRDEAAEAVITLIKSKYGQEF